MPPISTKGNKQLSMTMMAVYKLDSFTVIDILHLDTTKKFILQVHYFRMWEQTFTYNSLTLTLLSQHISHEKSNTKEEDLLKTSFNST